MFRSITLALCTVIIPLQLVFPYPAICETEDFDRTFTIDTGKPFTVDLDIDAGELKVRKSGEYNECRVSVEFNPKHFKPEITFNSERNRLDIEIECDLGFINDDSDRGKKMELVIELPYEPETDLRANIKAGEAEFLLGDLSLSNFTFRSLAGETTVEFDKPNRISCERLDVNTSVGETKLRRLGNARFHEADINGGVAEIQIDFSGDFIPGSYAKVDLDVGEANIIVPDNAGTKIRVSRFIFFSNANCPCSFTKRGHTYYSQNYDSYDNKLSLTVSAGIGELAIRTRTE